MLYLFIIVIFQSPFKFPIVLALLNASVFFFLIHFLSGIKYGLLFTIILAVLLSVDAYFAFVYSSYLSRGIVASILETNIAEITSMAKDIFIPAILIFFLTFFLIIKSQQELKKSNLSGKKSGLIFLCYVLLVIPGFVYYRIHLYGRHNLIEAYNNNPMLAIQEAMGNKFTLIYGDIISVIAYRNEMEKSRFYLDNKRKMPEGIYWDNAENRPEKIFLVIGESSWRRHYSLYGYEIQTTPFLDSIKNSGNLYFYEAISPSPVTRQVLPRVLSFATQFDFEPFYQYRNILELAEDAGYETVWISNHDPIGIYESFVTLIAKTSSDIYFEKTIKRDDLDLIPQIKKRYKKSRKQLFVIHLMGSHQLYADRYDKTDENIIAGKGVICEYDRTIYHTDRVLREIYGVMQAGNMTEPSSIIYYFSDHGEIIGKGHGLMDMNTAQFEVPFIIINNTNLHIPAITDKYRNRENNIVNTSVTPYVLSEIMGYNVSEKNVEKAVYNGKYIFHMDFKTYLYEDIERCNY